DSKDRSGPTTTFVALDSDGTGATPESSTATSTPLPVYPACHNAWAPVMRVTLVIAPGWVEGAKPSEVAPSLRSRDRPRTPGTARTPAAAAPSAPPGRS